MPALTALASVPVWTRPLTSLHIPHSFQLVFCENSVSYETSGTGLFKTIPFILCYFCFLNSSRLYITSYVSDETTTKMCWVLQGKTGEEGCLYCQHASGTQSWILLNTVRKHGACFTYGCNYKKKSKLFPTTSWDFLC